VHPLAPRARQPLALRPPARAGGDGPDALVTAVAWGTAAVTLPGSRMPTPADVDRDAVATTPFPDLDRVLT
jgi:1-phosphofructokinase